MEYSLASFAIAEFITKEDYTFFGIEELTKIALFSLVLGTFLEYLDIRKAKTTRHKSSGFKISI